MGAATLGQLREMQQRHDAVTDVRGIGLAMGLELNSPDAAERVLYDCLENGLWVKVSGGYRCQAGGHLVSDSQLPRF